VTARALASEKANLHRKPILSTSQTFFQQILIQITDRAQSSAALKTFCDVLYPANCP
jgi:hypothetical protein